MKGHPRLVMGTFGKGLVLAGLFCATVMPLPAHAFDFFGLFGSDEVKDPGVVDPVPYAATLVVNGGKSDLADKLENASILIRRQDEPPSGLVGLLARANDDRTNLVAKLYEEALFDGIVSIVINGRKLDAYSVTEEIATHGKKLPVTITVDPGVEFAFGQIRIENGDSIGARNAADEAGLAEGERASTKTILVAETAIVDAWRRAGHPYAEVSGHNIVADHATKTVDVAVTVAPGPVVTLGQVKIVGAKDVDADFLVRQADIPVGETYDPDIVEHARKNLAKLDALASVSVRVADEPDASGAAAVIIDVSERKPRTIGAGVNYSSTEGAGGDIFWVHRNLFGEAETLRLEAQIGRVFEAENLDDYDARFDILFGKPGVIDPYTRWDLRATAIQEDPEPYNRRGVVIENLLTHDFTEHFSLSSGFAYDWARIDDAFGRGYFTILSLPTIATYDSRDSVLDPTEGIYSRLKLEPQVSLDTDALYFTADSELRGYLALDDDHRFVLAARGLAGTIYGADIDDIPAHRRFYAGGGGSVRGYDYLNIGPRIEGYGATGGLARVEGSLEARIKVTETVGIVPFADAGFVTETAGFSGEDRFQVGVGLGLRYYSSVGPLRLDVAVPLDPQKHDPDFALYFGIGQAF